MELENTTSDEKILRRWKIKNNIAESTFRVYKSSIKGYCEATGMTLTELYEEAITEEEQRIPRYRKSINDHILEYKEYLDERGNAESSKYRAMKIVTSFYKQMDIELPRMPRDYDRRPSPENVGKMINKDIIRRMMELASTRDKAILSFAALTGQSPEEIRRLTIQDLMDSWNTKLEHKLFKLEDIFKQRNEILKNKCTKLLLRRSKTRNQYWVYLTAETSKYIIDYLHERVYGFNQKIRPYKPYNLNSPVFVTKGGEPFNRGSTLGKVFTDIGRRAGFDHPENFTDDMRLLLERREGKHRVWKAYNFRKYFINTCRRYAGTRSDSKTDYIFSGRELADFWVGHVPQGSIKHYLQYNQDDVDEMEVQFLQAYPYLSLEVEVETITTEDKAELEHLKVEYATMKQQLHDLQEYMRTKEKFLQLSEIFGQ